METKLQERGHENTVIFNVRSYISKFQLILCFNIDLKEVKDLAIFASWGRLLQCKAPLQLKHFLPIYFFRIGGAKSVSIFLRFYVLRLSLLD